MKYLLLVLLMGCIPKEFKYFENGDCISKTVHEFTAPSISYKIISDGEKNYLVEQYYLTEYMGLKELNKFVANETMKTFNCDLILFK